jgi:hypothetical protein
MAAVSPEAVELEAQRAELKEVLQSRSFARAPMMAHLLSYLCEKLFAGEACRIKEYSIGLEVFDRGAAFDQDSDSIVRVEANRLRKRLAEYYAGEGASHRLQITIPLGQYVPDFRVAVSSPVASLPETGPAANTGGSGFGRIAGRRWAGWFRPSIRRAWWLTTVLALVLLGYGGLFFLHLREPKPVAPTYPPSGAFAGSEYGPPVGEEIRILAGASRSFVDHAGKLWSADTGFTGGTAVKSAVQHIWRTQNPDFYRTSRQGEFRYDIPLKKGIYELRLHFAETVFGPESTGTGGEGDRIMTVLANGKKLLSWFDVAADAGASRTADVKIFPDITPGADGFLHLEFAGQDGKQAILSAIEILPGIHGRMRPERLLARQTPYYSNDSHWWRPDDYFEGGQMATYAAPVSGTDDPELYETERWGNFSYAIPVSPGRYSLVLHFAARHGDWPSPSSSDLQTKVAHIFNVFCNGKVLLENFDLAKEARESDVVVRKAFGLEPNAQGKLLLSFVPVQGYASVTGIEVLPQ